MPVQGLEANDHRSWFSFRVTLPKGKTIPTSNWYYPNSHSAENSIRTNVVTCKLFKKEAYTDHGRGAFAVARWRDSVFIVLNFV